MGVSMSLEPAGPVQACNGIALLFMLHTVHSPAISPHFISDMLQGVCKFCAVIMQILMEHDMFLYDT